MSFVDKFVDWAYEGLLQSPEAQEYLLGRGISKDQWKRHKLGYVIGDFEVDPDLDSKHSFICSESNKETECDSCKYNRWSSSWELQEGIRHKVIGSRIKNCVVFPLTTYSGTIIGFQVRSLVEKSYDTFAVKRRPEGYFFGIAANIESIWSKKEVWLVEGPADMLIMERLVIPNVLALTTNAVNPNQFRFLERFVHTINMCLDLDKAGREGVHRFMEKTGGRFKINDIKYPKANETSKDPGDLWKNWGDTKFKNYFNRKV
jgi:DNA primase